MPPAGKYDVRILRDEWGVPHIFGKRDTDVAYGLAYANAEDDWVNLQDAVLLSRARMASVHGKDAAKFDYLVQFFRVREFTEAQYEKALSLELRAVVEAYAEGITHYAAVNRGKMPHIDLPVTGKDVIVGASFKAPFFYDLQVHLEKLLDDEGKMVSRKGVVAGMFDRNPFAPAGTIGSNAWAVGPSRSDDGATRLAVNSHMPWEGPVTWYEAHVHSEEGWNVIGATFPGGPMIFKGHGETMGWCHTINRPDLCDVYELEINPDNKYQYKLDGVWRDLERAKARIRVKLLGPISWTFKKEMLWSEHGPVLRNAQGTFALRFAGYGEIRQLEQWYRMNKAHNLDEFLGAMRLNYLTSLNTLYADKDGNLFYSYTGRYPKRPEGFDWSGVLPGNTSAAIWTEFLPFEAAPQVLNPPSGLVQSCNNSPYRTTVGGGNPSQAGFPEAMGIETHMTNRGLRTLELYGADESISREEFYAYKYDKRYSAESEQSAFWDDLLARETPADPLLAEALALLKAWDRSADRKSPGAALATLCHEPYDEWKRLEKEPEPDPMDLLATAAKHLKKTFGRLDVPWEEMMRLRRGKLDLGLGGAPDCLRAIDVAVQKDGRYAGINGDCFFQMVQWDKDGKVSSESIHQYGAAACDTESPHYADQAPLFAEEKMRPTWFTEADIRAHLAREYRPGEFAGPWYKQ